MMGSRLKWSDNLVVAPEELYRATGEMTGMMYEVYLKDGVVLASALDSKDGYIEWTGSPNIRVAKALCQAHYNEFSYDQDDQPSVDAPQPVDAPKPTRNLNDIDNEIYGTLSSLLKREMTFDAARQRLLKLCEELRG